LRHTTCASGIETQFSFSCVSEVDVFKTLSFIKSKAVGLDLINPVFVKILLPFLLPFITCIYNKILTTSVFPSKWKEAKVTPIPKLNGEHRPIAILPFLSKGIEKIMHEQMIAFLDQHNLLFKRQSGFRSNRSCITALCDVTEDIRTAMDKNEVSILGLLDHSKAFDSIDCLVLCAKLKHFFHFSTSATKLIQSYLQNRSQAVVVGDNKSSLLPLTRKLTFVSVSDFDEIWNRDSVGHKHSCNIYLMGS